MKNKDLEKIAKKVLELEQACRHGDNLPENMTKMDMIMSSLESDDLFALVELLEETTCNL